MYEYMLCWRNDWVNQKTESNYPISTRWRVLIVVILFRPSWPSYLVNFSYNRCADLVSAEPSSLTPLKSIDYSLPPQSDVRWSWMCRILFWLAFVYQYK